MGIGLLAITSIRSTETEALKHYLDTVGPLMDSAGARVIEQYQIARALVGDQPPQFVTLIEYPDQASIDMVFKSEAYMGLAQIRDKAFTHYQISILK